MIKLGIYTIMNLKQALNNGLVSKKVHKVIKFNRNALVSEPNYHAKSFFTENVLATALKKAEILRNKNFYLGLLILELSKIFIYEFWYDYVKPKYGKKARICCMDITNVIVYKKTGYIHKDTAEDVETRLDTSNYELDKPLPKEKIKKKLD